MEKTRVKVREPAITYEILSAWTAQAEFSRSNVLEVDLMVDIGRGQPIRPLWQSTMLAAGMHGGDEKRGDVIFDLAASPVCDLRDRAVHEGPAIVLEEPALNLNDLLNLMSDGINKADQARIRFVERRNNDNEAYEEYEDLGWLRASQIQRVSRGIAYVLLSPRAPTVCRVGCANEG